MVGETLELHIPSSSLAFLLSKRIAKELSSANHLDCELRSLLKLSIVRYFNRQWYVFSFSFSSVLSHPTASKIQWLKDEERNEEMISYSLIEEKQQEICKGN